MIIKKDLYEITEYLSDFACEIIGKSEEKRSILVDIETTGLSSTANHIYCIGCGYIEDSKINVTLLFAENREDEKNVLNAFYSLLKSFDQIITFNGSTFDLPFIVKRTELLLDSLSDVISLDSIPHLDIYKECRKLKCMLGLGSLKQKAIEEFLGISRDDEMNGGELINVYHQFVNKSKNCEACEDELNLLLLHNHDDILGMFPLLDMLSYSHLANREFYVNDLSIDTAEFAIEAIKDTLGITDNHYSMVKGVIKTELIINQPVPKGFIYRNDMLFASITTNRISVSIPVFYGKLNHYFEDYKNYYRMIAEGTLIHKNIGDYLDSSLREKVKKEDCFVGGYVIYISLPAKKANYPFNYYRKEYKDTSAYLEIKDLNDISDLPIKSFINTYLSFQ